MKIPELVSKFGRILSASDMIRIYHMTGKYLKNYHPLDEVSLVSAEMAESTYFKFGVFKI